MIWCSVIKRSIKALTYKIFVIMAGCPVCRINQDHVCSHDENTIRLMCIWLRYHPENLAEFYFCVYKYFDRDINQSVKSFIETFNLYQWVHFHKNILDFVWNDILRQCWLGWLPHRKCDKKMCFMVISRLSWLSRWNEKWHSSSTPSAIAIGQSSEAFWKS